MGLRFEDYAAKLGNREDEIQSEINEAAQATEARRDIPESVRKRFDGKSIDEVLEAYSHAEKKISEQGETIGKLRKTSDQLIELQLQAPSLKPVGQDSVEPEPEPVTSDSLYNDPEGVITKVVDRRTSAHRKEIAEELELLRATRAQAALTEKFPDWKETIQSEEFGEWVGKSDYRKRLAVAGNSYDLAAAFDLLEMWNDHNSRSQEEAQQQQRRRQLDDATLESSSPEGFEPEETFSRYELMQKRIQAKSGNRAAEEWLRAHSAAINLAYSEGRIKD